MQYNVLVSITTKKNVLRHYTLKEVHAIQTVLRMAANSGGSFTNGVSEGFFFHFFAGA